MHTAAVVGQLQRRGYFRNAELAHLADCPCLNWHQRLSVSETFRNAKGVGNVLVFKVIPLNECISGGVQTWIWIIIIMIIITMQQQEEKAIRVNWLD